MKNKKILLVCVALLSGMSITASNSPSKLLNPKAKSFVPQAQQDELKLVFTEHVQILKMSKLLLLTLETDQCFVSGSLLSDSLLHKKTIPLMENFIASYKNKQLQFVNSGKKPCTVEMIDENARIIHKKGFEGSNDDNTGCFAEGLAASLSEIIANKKLGCY